MYGLLEDLYGAGTGRSRGRVNITGRVSGRVAEGDGARNRLIEAFSLHRCFRRMNGCRMTREGGLFLLVRLFYC